MIKIDRVPVPSVLRIGEVPESVGEIETKDAIQFYSLTANHGLKFQKMGVRGARIKESYSVYANTEVRKALTKMSYGKCAYCETKITSIYSGDIEHFRPKGGYHNNNNEPLSQPGYYWLAAEWENLLFACPFCNQTNTQEILAGGNIREVVQGKLNQFPLLDEASRLDHLQGSNYFIDRGAYDVAFADEEADRLLLKPCTDDVERHFKYSEEGLILAKEGLTPTEEQRARESIRVYALQRITLVQSRAERVIEIKAQLKRVEQAVRNLNIYFSNSMEERTWFEGILRDEMAILKRYMDCDQEYAGLARYIIDQYFANL